MSEQRQGVLFGVAAYLAWGIFPLYWPLLKPASAFEILAHRVTWSLAVMVVLLARTGGVRRLRRLEARKVRLLVMAACLVAFNWGLYIWAVNHGHVVETALGYFINPLVTVLLGVFVLAERLRRPQWIALGLAAVAVLVLAIDYGRVPWIALSLATSFAFYGLTKKRAGVGAIESLSVETGVLFLPALGFLLWLSHAGHAVFGQPPWTKSVLLASAGPATAIPLLCFGAAAIRVPLSMLGLLQYIAPTLQFLCGVVVFREEMPPSRWFGFALVWMALIIFSVDGIARRPRSPA
jgi:chloramphenicol-sensitive protein RarD